MLNVVLSLPLGSLCGFQLALLGDARSDRLAAEHTLAVGILALLSAGGE